VTTVAVTYRYTDDVAARDRLLIEHRSFLRRLADQGLLLASGPYGPDEPRGALFLFSADKEQVAALLDNDPFVGKGVIATRELTTWVPLIGPLAATFRP